jgi:hypothetical protein
MSFPFHALNKLLMPLTLLSRLSLDALNLIIQITQRTLGIPPPLHGRFLILVR